LTRLAIEGLNVWYGNVHALRGVSLTVGDGECIGVLGPNGAGKSTLFRAISRIVPSTGSISLDGVELPSTPEKVARRGIAHVLEGRHIFPGMTVEDNLLLAQFSARRSDFARDLERMLELFPILRQKFRTAAGELSGGQQQILALGQGLLMSPRILLLDEPSLGLAPIVVEQLASVIPSIRREWKTSILISEQLIELVFAVAGYIYVIRRGEVAYRGEADRSSVTDQVLGSYFGDAG
jgi:branched-chain amino acid transport system ATP-binding protein